MKKHLVFLSMVSFFTITSVSGNVTISDSIVKYNKMKEENYLQRLIRERDALISDRDGRELVRGYKNAKTYCYTKTYTRYICQ